LIESGTTAKACPHCGNAISFLASIRFGSRETLLLKWLTQLANLFRIVACLIIPQVLHERDLNCKVWELRIVQVVVSVVTDGQSATPEPQASIRREMSSTVRERDRKVRDAALCRAKGRCELCKQPGFRMVVVEFFLRHTI
jgi:hypothetical protein